MSSDLLSTKHEKHFFEALDGWRGICACMVALFHFRAYSHIADLSFIKSGGSFLDFFFVLSGFVIFANYYERLKSGFSLKKFMLLRFGRLYPLHFATFMAFILGDLLQLAFPWLEKGATYAPFHGPGEGLRYIVANLLLLHSFNVTDRLSFNDPSWSISGEFYTYLVFAVAIILSKGRAWVVALLTLITLAYMVINPVHMQGTYNGGVIRCIYGFGCGALIWFAFLKLSHRFINLKIKLFDFLEILAFLGAFIFVHFLYNSFEALPYMLVTAPVVFSLIVFIFAFQRGIVSKILTNRFFSFLGALSYSIYMLHIIISGKVFFGLGHLLQKALGISLFTIVDGVSVPGTNLWIGDAIYIVYLASVVTCSYITYRVIEVPSRDWFRKLAKRISE